MRRDLLLYENYLCYISNENVHLVARNGAGSFDMLTIDRKVKKYDQLSVSVETFEDEDAICNVIPFARQTINAKSGGSFSFWKRLSPSDDNSLSSSKKETVFLQRVFPAYGIVGFVRFLHGYYVIVISDKSQVASVGHHAIYKIDRVETIYIPIPQAGVNDPNEVRYIKTFLNVDLTNNFYLSYTYDLTRTLQSWLDGPAHASPAFEQKYMWNHYLLKPFKRNIDQTAASRWAIPIIHGFASQGNVNSFGRHIYVTLIARRSRHFAGTRYLKRGISTEGYVANEVETEQIVFENAVHALAEIDSNKIPLRSTDGIGLCSSFVQMRGSVPALWTQDIASMSMVGPPPISVFGHDLCMELAGQHFSQLLSRYGAPVIVVDLVKTSQKSASKYTSKMTTGSNAAGKLSSSQKSANQQDNVQFISPSEAQKEALLRETYLEAVNYLNQYIEPDFRIQYIHIDLAHMYRKDATGSVTVSRLIDVGKRVASTCGICTYFSGNRQTGIVRTNCVDCLDRTNAAQLTFGLVALGYQFYALGAISQPVIELDSYCFRLFEALFEDMGDILALQYGGSLLVHHFAAYRRAAPWISQSRDKLEQVSRLLNNTFSDTERQHGKNLFLGIFQPFVHHRGTGISPGQAIWDMINDYDLHNPVIEGTISATDRRRRLVQWFDLKLLKSLPLPEPLKPVDLKESEAIKEESTFDAFLTYFQPGKLTFFEDCHEFKMLSTTQLTPAGGILLPDTDLDPFVSRGTRKMGTSLSNSSKTGGSLLWRFWHPTPTDSSGSGKSNEVVIDANSQTDVGPGNSDIESEGSQDVELLSAEARSLSGHRISVDLKSAWPPTTFSDVFKSQGELFGCDIGDSSVKPNGRDARLYEQYCRMAEVKAEQSSVYIPIPEITPMSHSFRPDIDFLNTTVPDESIKLYESYVRSRPGQLGPGGALWAPEDRSSEFVDYFTKHERELFKQSPVILIEN